MMKNFYPLKRFTRIGFLVATFFVLLIVTLTAQGKTDSDQSVLAGNIIRIDTNPVNIQGFKDLDALQDGIYHEDAVVREVDMNTGIIVEFDEPTALYGFMAAVGGTYGNPNGYVWTIAKADNWEDMRTGSGSFGLIVTATLMTDSGLVNLPFDDVHTAKVFQISGDNTVGNGYVSYQEVLPVFEEQIPAVYQSVQTGPEGLGTNAPHLLFDGRIDPFALINPVENTPVTIVLDYGSCQATWTGLWGNAGGYPEAEEYTWMLEAADSMADLTSQTGSYQLVFENYPTDGDKWLEIDDLGGEVDGHVFQITILRREDHGSGWEHVTEIEPHVKQLVCTPPVTNYQLFLPVVLDVQ